jgi:hypothetical protein
MPPSSSSLVGLRRTKSTSSVSYTSHHSSTLIDDPVISSAHQQALAAAHLAFARGSGRENVRPDGADRVNLRAGSMEVIHEGPVVVEPISVLRRSQSQQSTASG